VKWIEARIVYDPRHDILVSDIITDILLGLGLQGVIQEDPEFEESGSWDDTIWRDESAVMPSEHAVVGYFPLDDKTDDLCRLLEAHMARLKTGSGIISRLSFREIDDQDWSESWKAHFQPLALAPGITVKPTWRDYEARPEELVIDIDPGMAFGTGTHPTSQLCVQMIQSHMPPCSSFLDIGTGSGILLIAAAKLGAKSGLGVDIDPTAVSVAQENLALNQIDTAAFRLRTGSFVEGIEGRFDFIVANLLPNLLSTLLEEILTVLAPEGILVCSGILEENELTTRRELTARGFSIVDIRKKKT